MRTTIAPNAAKNITANALQHFHGTIYSSSIMATIPPVPVWYQFLIGMIYSLPFLRSLTAICMYQFLIGMIYSGVGIGQVILERAYQFLIGMIYSPSRDFGKSEIFGINSL